MLISEKQLRSVVRQMLEEQASLASGSGGPSAQLTSAVKQGKGGYEYQIFSNGKIQILKRDGKVYNPPLVLSQQQAVAVAKEQIELGDKGYVAKGIADGTLKFDPTSEAPAPTASATAGPVAGFVVIGRQDFFPLDVAGQTASKAVTSLIGQGHGFAIVVDPNTKVGHRYDFGRYPEAAKCQDDRWLTKAGAAVAGKEAFNQAGIHTMGIALYKGGTVAAKVSTDGKQITNLSEFAKGIRKSNDSAGDLVVIPVTDARAAFAFASSMVGKCFPYALPGFGFLTTGATMNCGVFAQKVLEAGKPAQALSVQENTLVDTPDALYNTAAGMGFQTGKI